MISNLFIIAGLVFILIGIMGLFRLETLQARVMSSTLVDTVGYLLILIGMILKWGFSFVSLKIMVVIFLMLIINPLFTHFLMQSAWKSGHKEDVKREDEKYDSSNISS